MFGGDFLLRIDEAILTTNTNICKNINMFDESERGFLSQNILAQLRNFVEYIAVKIYSKGEDANPNDHNYKGLALDSLQKDGKLRFLSNFHNLLQKSVSHYTYNEDGSERLMLKYYEYLLKVKLFLKDKYNFEVLENIEDFPINNDTQLIEYYEKISEKIVTPSRNIISSAYSDSYYIQKIKPFFVNQQIFYVVTFMLANDRTSKFDKIIAFTKLDILSNYAVKLSIHYDSIDILGKKWIYL